VVATVAGVDAGVVEGAAPGIIDLSATTVVTGVEGGAVEGGTVPPSTVVVELTLVEQVDQAGGGKPAPLMLVGSGLEPPLSRTYPPAPLNNFSVSLVISRFL